MRIAAYGLNRELPRLAAARLPLYPQVPRPRPFIAIFRIMRPRGLDSRPGALVNRSWPGAVRGTITAGRSPRRSGRPPAWAYRGVFPIAGSLGAA
ncbi:MAG: hypothetical protein DCC67_14670 [Planctomycetota bacterium]|nr:MAG: hypothetical protein DCC67_14670 [Planctomycetota bacterium]